MLQRLAVVVTAGTLAGIDTSPAIVARARRRLRTLIRASRFELHCGGAEALPLRAASFTKLCSVNSAFYGPNLAEPLAEFRRVLVPAGRLVLCLTHRRSLETKRFARHGLQLYEPADVHAALTTAGFKHVHLTTAADRHHDFFTTTATTP